MNLFADMGVQPGTLQAGLVAATASTDVTAPVSVITTPLSGATLTQNVLITISGTASDANVVAGVEVSVDGGLTWKPATGTTNWTFNWTPTATGTVTIKVRGIDDSGNMEAAGTPPSNNAITVTVTPGAPAICPCNIWSPSTIPGTITDPDGSANELGVKFRSFVNGYITGIRFYKSTTNTGTHIGNLWSSTGTNLAQATFTGETASGWQQVSFAAPIAITAGTTYIASYHTNTGHYSVDENYFATSGIVTTYLEALQNGTDGPNGVYATSATTTFPTSSFNSSNYYVDVVFQNSANTWKGTVSVAWENPANWSWGMVPNTNTDVIINAGSPYNPTISSNVTIRSLTLNTSGLLTVTNTFKLDIKIP